MAQLCPHCHRANPDAAVFCYFDGIPLRAGAVPALPTVGAGAELVFPSGQRCNSLARLREACCAEWNQARQMLLKGAFVRFLQTLGRTDLVRTVQEAGKQQTAGGADPDIALHNFLDQLPASPVPGPRLELEPRRVVLKDLAIGKRQQVHLTVSNGGPGVLQGKLKVSDGQEWLRLEGNPKGQDAGGQQIGLHALRTQEVVLHVDTRALIGGQTYSGKLTAITNGGIAEVPIRLDLTVVPFPHAPYQGASSPRELAQRMLKNPKPGVILLESGQVSRWFTVNGWSYPVSGEPARGIGAVQQFFECLGLSKPPPLQLSDSEMRLQCRADQLTAGQITLRTPSRKWVYAQVDSDASWLRITSPTVSGPQQVQISFEVDPNTAEGGSLAGDRLHQASVRIRANGNQKLAVRVQVEVRRPKMSPAAAMLRPMLIGALLGLLSRWLLVLPADLYARLWVHRGEAGIGTLADWVRLPGAEDGFLRSFVLAAWWLGGVVGLALVWRRGGKWPDRLCGLVAGSAAGLAVFSVLGCLLILLDAVPRTLMRGLAAVLGWHRSVWLALPFWVLSAGLSWALIGGIVGLVLAGMGAKGKRWLNAAATPLASVCRLLGMKDLARWLKG